MHVSTNAGSTWTEIPTPYPVRDLAYANGTFVGVGDYSSITRSTDALTWQSQQLSNTFLTSVQFGSGSFVTAGIFGYLWSSPDALNWTPHVVGMSGIIRSLAFGNDRWVLGGDSGFVARSSAIGPFFNSDLTRVLAGNVNLSIDNSPGQTIALEATSDLQHWNTVTNLQEQSVTIPEPASASRMFYRLRQ